MSNFKALYIHEQEEDIAIFCAKNNIEFNETNAYDTVLETFKDNPIKRKKKDEDTGEEKETNITFRVARQIEFETRTIARIAAKAEVYKKRFAKETYAKNIEQAKKDSKPDLQMLVDNLYRLNIVDGHSYQAFVCFLMQLKYSRDTEVPENDKTCVFFNGVARNGKSATAKAIYEVEAQYGKVFKAQSGKILESTHEEQVWQSHLNYFDEVKPTDIDRELLLTIINGGNVELNPKNKQPYNYHVNTNNIFTSNDQINLLQRRISVIKFGNRLNGRPLGEGTLKEIITNIMNSLPDFDHYYDLHDVVSLYNENCVNPLAVESIMTFIGSKLGFVKAPDGRTLTAELTFAPHDIYNSIKDKYNKQMINSERRDAIHSVLGLFVEKGFIKEKAYPNCSTTYYTVTGENYLKLEAEYQKVNTCREVNVKITKNGLYDLMLPFFTNASTINHDENNNNSEEQLQNTITVNARDLCNAHAPLIKFIDDNVYDKLHHSETYQKQVTADVQNKGTMLLRKLLNQIQTLVNDADDVDNFPFVTETMNDVINKYITSDVCQYVSCKGLIDMLNRMIDGFNESHAQLVKDIYIKYTGITDESTMQMADESKISYIPEGCPDEITIQDSWTYKCEQSELRKEQRKKEAALYKKEHRERKKALEEQRLLANQTTVKNSSDNSNETQNV